MTRSTLVIGAGAAGLAAAWSALRSGREVTIVSSGVGASGLSSGALDAVPWDAHLRASASRLRTPELAELLRDLGIFHLGDPGETKLATMAGRLRSADGCDRALLDLGPIPAGRVLVPRVSRAGWDADAIAATLNDQPPASPSRHTFEAVDATILRYDNERPIVDADLAARHDDPARLEWLAARLREGLAGSHAVAILLGPWLGAREPRASALSELVGVPVGEALMGIGSPAGLRFEAARDRMLASRGVARETSRVTRVVRDGSRLRATFANGRDLQADDVILAIGGLSGGGLRYEPPEHAAGDDLPARGRRAFSLSLEIDVDLALHGVTLDIVSSLHGPYLDASAWPSGDRRGALEDVGVRCEGVVVAPGITAAGDAVADRPRTMLQAFASGIRAGAS